MNRDLTLATELTEEDVGGEMHVARRLADAAGATGAGGGMNLQATTNGGLGLLVACLALWAVYRLFPGNERDARPAATLASQPAAGTAAPPAQQPVRPGPDAVTVELGADGIVIKRRQAAAASTPASGVAKPARKTAPPVLQTGSQPATRAEHGGTDAPAPAADPTR